MEASDASAPEGRALRIFAGILTAIALMPAALGSGRPPRIALRGQFRQGVSAHAT